MREERDALRQREASGLHSGSGKINIRERLRAEAAEAELAGLREALRAVDAVLQWIGTKHKDVLVECPTELWRQLVACRLRLRGWENIGSGWLMSPRRSALLSLMRHVFFFFFFFFFFRSPGYSGGR